MPRSFGMTIPHFRRMFGSRNYMIGGTVVFLMAMAAQRATSMLGAESADEYVLSDSASPNGRYALALRTISVGTGNHAPEATDGGPDSYASPFLVGLKPQRAIREIKKSFHDFRNHPGNDFEWYWRGDSSMIGVVHMQRGGCELAVLAKRGSRWHQLLLPEVALSEYNEDIARHARLKLPVEGTWHIEAMSFNRHGIFVVSWGMIDGDDKYVDAHAHYHFLRRNGRRVARVDGINVDIDRARILVKDLRLPVRLVDWRK